jgi:2'-5' RNA ligase
VGADDRLRLFLALRLPEPALDALVEWQLRLRAGGRVVPREHLHATLAFLGHRPRADVEPVVGALRAAAVAAAGLELEPLRYRETRSVGMIVCADHGGRGAAFADDLQARLEALGVYRREGRPWLPHVTVLRFRQRPRLAPGLPELGRFVPSDAAAYLSRLSPEGARYEVLQVVPLGG